MKIAQVSALYPPDFNAGGTLACHHLALALVRRGHDVSVFAGRMAGNAPPLEERDQRLDGIPVHGINVAGHYGPGVSNYDHPAVAERFALWLQETRPQVVHFHSLQALGAGLIPVAKSAGARVVVTMHDAWFACAQQFLVTPPPQMRACPPFVDPNTCDCIPGFDFAARRRFLDAALEHADRVIAVSPFLERLLATNGIAPGKVVVSENGLVPASPRPRSSSRAVRFAFLGGAHPWKGIGTLAAALPALRGEVRVDLWGVGAEEWRAAGGAGGDSRVRCRRGFEAGELAAVMADADVVLVPSAVNETFSLVVREAFQHGLPVIASECGGPLVVLEHERNGLVFPKRDAAALAAAMQRVVDDPSLRARLAAEAGRSAIRSIDEQAADVERIYREPARPATESEAPLPRSVLFISGIEGAPFRYRVLNLMEQLDDLGIRSTARYYRDMDALTLAGQSEILVLYRVPWDDYVAKVIARARSAGALPVFSVDDLIFDPAVAKVSALENQSPADRRAWAQGTKLYRRTAEACDAFLGSTDALARAAAPLGKPTFVHRNTLSRELVRLSEAARLASENRPRDGATRLGYFSGTRTHDADLASISSSIAAVMGRRPEVRLMLVGPVTVPRSLEPFRDRIDMAPFVSWQELPDLISRVDVNLVPLADRSVFCEAKSELKWFEAAVCGVATIASATEPYQHAIRSGETGFLAENASEWEAAIEALASDVTLRGRIARAAREDAYARHGPAVAAQAIAGTLRSLSALAPGKELTRLAPVTLEELATIRASGLGIGHVALEPAEATAGPAQLLFRKASSRIAAGLVARQAFRCTPGELFRVDVVVGTHRAAHRHELLVSLRDGETWVELSRGAADTSLACDNAWFAIEVDPLRIIEARELVLELSSPGASRGEGLSIWTEPSLDGRGQIGEERGLDLAFRTWLWPLGRRPRRRIDVAHLEPAHAVEELARFAEMERDRADDLAKRLARAEERLGLLAAELAATRQPIERLKRTLAFRAARKAYRLLRGRR